MAFPGIRVFAPTASPDRERLLPEAGAHRCSRSRLCERLCGRNFRLLSEWGRVSVP
ncbi:hypothetical protein FHX37_4367 [Haloactinospora alba]|uniref:Uncharacterized protein n=1 Tax=Haloactinospora alba TaxID=405555 RepID=A0A543N765_9ACTN|nr:hypothetical protein FHX37_4367 [Haloactinospora alba]